jgi:hypothetical protein
MHTLRVFVRTCTCTSVDVCARVHTCALLCVCVVLVLVLVLVVCCLLRVVHCPLSTASCLLFPLTTTRYSQYNVHVTLLCASMVESFAESRATSRRAYVRLRVCVCEYVVRLSACECACADGNVHCSCVCTRACTCVYVRACACVYAWSILLIREVAPAF